MLKSLKRLCSFRLSLAVAAASLAACSGDGSPIGPKAGGRAPARSTSSTRIVVKIPHASDARAVARYLRNAGAGFGRKPLYLSPATQSIAIEITDANQTTTTVNANLSVNTSASGANPAECTSTALSTICTITLALTPGSYDGRFATYDGALDGGGVPTGAALSKNQSVAFTVVAGTNNQLTVSLAAIPAGVTIVPAFNEKLVRGSEANGFSLLVTGTAHTFNVAALDADGDVIVGPGAPAFSVALSQNAGASVTSVGPSQGNPNSFTFTTTKPFGGGFPKDPQNPPPLALTVQAIPPSGAGVVCSTATCSRSVTLDSVDVFFAGYVAVSGVFAPGDASAFATTAPVANASAVDAVGNVFFAYGNTIYEWSPPYDAAAIALFTESSVPNIPDIAVSPGGTIYFDGITDTTATPFTYSAFFSRPPYTSHANFLTPLSFTSQIENQSRLLADANDKVIIAQDGQVLVTDSALSSRQSLTTPKAQLVFDPAGELIVFDPSAQIITAYAYDVGSGKYVAGVVNKNASYEVPMRAGGNGIYLPRRSANQVAFFASPLTTNAPKMQSEGGSNSYYDFVVTNDGKGVAKIGNGTALEEVFGIGATSPDIIEASGGANSGGLFAIH